MQVNIDKVTFKTESAPKSFGSKAFLNISESNYPKGKTS